MAHIEKTEFGTYKVRYRDDANRARSKTFKRKVDAERFVKSVGADVMRGEYVDPRDQRIGFGGLIDDWWATTAGLLPSTRTGYAKIVKNHVRPHFGHMQQGAIDVRTMKRFVAEKLEAGFAPKYVADMVSIVSLVMKNAVDSGVRRDNPAAGIAVPRRKTKVQPAQLLTMDQVHALVDHVRDPYKPAVWLLVICGLRPSELCGLRVQSVDFVRRRLTVSETLQPVHKDAGGEYRLVLGPPKTDAGLRSMPLPEWLLDDLAAMLAERDRRGPQDWLFESPVPGRPLNRDWFRQRLIRPALEAAGLPVTFRNYDFRHLHASLLIEDNMDPLRIAHRMGHVDSTVTFRVYGHLLNNDQQELTDRLDERVRSARPTGRGSVVDLDARRRSVGE